MRDAFLDALELNKVSDEIEEYLNSDNYEIFSGPEETLEIRDLTGKKLVTATTKGEKTVFFGEKMYDLDIFSFPFDKTKIQYKE